MMLLKQAQLIYSRYFSSVEAAGDVQPERIKDLLFYVNKSMCIIVQMMFTIYEFVQVK